MLKTALTVSFWQQVAEWDRSLFLYLNHNLAITGIDKYRQAGTLSHQPQRLQRCVGCGDAVRERIDVLGAALSFHHGLYVSELWQKRDVVGSLFYLYCRSGGFAGHLCF